MIDELLSLAGDAVTHARRLGADAVHAVAADGRSTEISVREGQIEKVEQAEARDISLKVYVGKSSATISGSVLTTEAIRRLAENAVNMAKLAPPDPHAGVADPDIVRLCELNAFLAYEIRLIAGLRLLREKAA